MRQEAMLKFLRISLTGCALACSGIALAQDAQFYFAEQGSLTRITQKAIGPAGADFWLTVVLHNRGTSPLTYDSANLLVGLGTTNSQGTGATPTAFSMN